jgi:hypothetical protein
MNSATTNPNTETFTISQARSDVVNPLASGYAYTSYSIFKQICNTFKLILQIIFYSSFFFPLLCILFIIIICILVVSKIWVAGGFLYEGFSKIINDIIRGILDTWNSFAGIMSSLSDGLSAFGISFGNLNRVDSGAYTIPEKAPTLYHFLMLIIKPLASSITDAFYNLRAKEPYHRIDIKNIEKSL